MTSIPSARPALSPNRRTGRRSRLAVLVAGAALVLAGCGGGESQGEAAPTPTASPTPTVTADVPEGVDLTQAGAQLAFGDTATVAHELRSGRTAILELTVDSAQRGRLADLAGFALDDPLKKQAHYYYVRVSVGNAGENVVGDFAVPLWGVSGESTLLQAVEFTSSFKRCPTENLPKRFKPGDEFTTCLVYLSPNKGALEGVSYRPDPEFIPIEWHGTVKQPPAAKSSGGGG